MSLFANMSDVFSYFSYLPDFVPLIQLLVGSVFIASYFSKGHHSFYDVICKIREVLESVVGDLTDYELIKTERVIEESIKLDSRRKSRRHYTLTRVETINPDSIRLNEDYTTIKKSIMFVMALYGAFVLFYCAKFKQATCCATAVMPSPSGLLLLSFVVTIYVIYRGFYLGKKKPNIKWTIFVTFIMIVVFLSFIVLPFDFTFVPDNWYGSLHVIANIWTLLNLGVLWLFILLKKRMLPSILLKKAKRLSSNLPFDLNLASQYGIVNRLKYITEKSKNKRYKTLRLLKMAFKDLRNDRLYFIPTANGYTISNDLYKQLIVTIKDSGFNIIEKIILKKAVMKKPRVNISKNTPPILDIINSERSKFFEQNSDVERFINIGIIVKKK